MHLHNVFNGTELVSGLANGNIYTTFLVTPVPAYRSVKLTRKRAGDCNVCCLQCHCFFFIFSLILS